MKNKKNMFTLKKTLALFSIIITITILSSCKSHEKCPAYGKVQPEKTNSEKSS